MYTSYDVAHQLLQIRNYVEVHASGFAELPKDVLSAMLHLTAEYRNAQEMEMLIQMGADPHEKHGGFTVLEMFVQGHDGYWRDKDRVKEVEDGVKMLTKYGVTCEDLTRPWILKNCCEIINNSEYLGTFFRVEIHEAPVPEVGFVHTRRSVPLASSLAYKSQPLHDMAYYMVITSDGFLQSIRGVYDSREKADARADSLEESTSCEIIEFDALNQDCDVKW